MFKKFAKARVIEVKSSAEKLATASLTKFSDYSDYRTDDGYLYVRVRAISSRVNKNNDGWPAEELVKSWRTFLGKPIFVDHHNHDPKKARGVIVDAALYQDKDNKTSALDPYYASAPAEHLPPTHIELLLEIDAKRFPKLAKAIIDGDIDGVSMGANVEYTKCSHCANIAHAPEEYCVHVRNKGAHFDYIDKHGHKTSKRAYEDCYKVGFFEISCVFDPADETALTIPGSIKAAKVAAIHKEADLSDEAPQSQIDPEVYSHLKRAAQTAWDREFQAAGGDALYAGQKVSEGPGASNAFLAAKRAVEKAGHPELAFAIANEIKTGFSGMIENAAGLGYDDGDDGDTLDYAFMDMPQGMQDELAFNHKRNSPAWMSHSLFAAEEEAPTATKCEQCGSENLTKGDYLCAKCRKLNARESSVKTAQNPPPQSDMTTRPEKVNTLRQEQICPICGSEMDEGKCEVCNFEEPPKGMDNPDLDKAREVDQQQQQQDADQAAQQEAGPPANPQSLQAPQTPPQMGQPGGAPMGMPMAAKYRVFAWNAPVTGDRTAAQSSQGGRVNAQERPILPATRQLSDRPINHKTIKDSTQPVQSSTREETRMSDQIKTADGATADGGSEVQPDKRVDLLGVGGVSGDPLSGIQHENVESETGANEVAPHTDTWSKGEGDSLGQHEPVSSGETANDLGGPIGTAVSKTVIADGAKVTPGTAYPGTESQTGYFPDHEPERVDLLKDVADAVGPRTMTFGDDDMHVGDPITNEDGAKAVGGPIFQDSTVATSAVYAHAVKALKLAETEVSLGIIDAEEKFNRVADLETMPSAEIDATLNAYAKARTAGLKKEAPKPQKVASMPSFKPVASVDYEDHSLDHINPEDSLW